MDWMLMVIGLSLGCGGIYFMVLGAKALGAGTPKEAVAPHFYGVLFLTASAVVTFLLTGDGSYLVMQPPFLMAVTVSYLSLRVTWWNWKSCLLFAVACLGFGLIAGWGTHLSVLQMVSAGIVAVGLAVSVSHGVMRLTLLGVGRIGLCLTSLYKGVVIEPLNPAAWVWFALMAWAAYVTMCEALRLSRKRVAV